MTVAQNEYVAPSNDLVLLLSHGTNGLILAYGLTLFALIATLIQ